MRSGAPPVSPFSRSGKGSRRLKQGAASALAPAKQGGGGLGFAGLYCGCPV